METKLEPHIIRLLKPEGFNKAFEERLIDFDTYEKAYESVERMYEMHFGERKYSGYESFRQVRNRLIKAKQKVK